MQGDRMCLLRILCNYKRRRSVSGGLCLSVFATDRLLNLSLLSEHPQNFFTTDHERGQKALQCTQEPLCGHPAVWVWVCPTVHKVLQIQEGKKALIECGMCVFIHCFSKIPTWKTVNHIIFPLILVTRLVNLYRWDWSKEKKWMGQFYCIIEWIIACLPHKFQVRHRLPLNWIHIKFRCTLMGCEEVFFDVYLLFFLCPSWPRWLQPCPADNRKWRSRMWLH